MKELSPEIKQALEQLVFQGNCELETHKQFYFLFWPNQEELGPFESQALKSFTRQTPLPTQTLIREHGSDSHSSLYEHPQFQRRSPQAVANKSASEGHSIYFLKDGQKIGPIDFDELKELVENRTLLLTDTVSFNGGESWSKLFEFEEFDRRLLSHQNLPHRPHQEVLQSSQKEVNGQLFSFSEQKKEEEAIAGLAFIENVKSGKTNADVMDFKTIEKSAEKQQEEQGPERELEDLDFEYNSQAPKQRSWSYAFLTLLFLVGSLYFFNETRKSPTISKQNPKRPQKAKVTKAKNVSVLKPVEAKTVSKKRFYRPRKRAPSRAPSSFQSSNSFKRRKSRRMEDNPLKEGQNSESHRYDDGSDPVQLDPVRSKISKETLNPEEDYEDRQELDNAERKLASLEDGEEGWPSIEQVNDAIKQNDDELFDSEEDY